MSHLGDSKDCGLSVISGLGGTGNMDLSVYKTHRQNEEDVLSRIKEAALVRGMIKAWAKASLKCINIDADGHGWSRVCSEHKSLPNFRTIQGACEDNMPCEIKGCCATAAVFAEFDDGLNGESGEND